MNPGRRTALFLLSSLTLFALRWHEIRDLIRYALDTDHTNASQVLLIPFVSGFLIFRDRIRIFLSRSVGSLAGCADCSAGTRPGSSRPFPGYSS